MNAAFPRMTAHCAVLADAERRSLWDVAPEPWKNGAGLTRTLACSHRPGAPDGFDWRVSVAEIEHGGPFSVFPGMDRIAVVLEHGPLRLSSHAVQGEVAAPRVLAPQFVPTAYSGDDELFADVDGAPIRCLNVMTRRGIAQARVESLDSDGPVVTVGQVLLFATGGAPWKLTGSGGHAIALAPYDSLFLRGTAAIHAKRLGDQGRLIAVHLRASASC